MPPSAPTQIDPPAPARSTASRLAWRAALISGAVALVVAFGVDRWHERQLMETERARVRVLMAPYANSVQDAVQRRVALLIGLRSFVDSRRTRRALDDEFPTYAAGMISGAPGVQALQLVERGRIVATWPLVGNEEALGYDLLADPRPVLGADVRRALTSGEVTVTGPLPLVQGGDGLLVRQAVSPRPGFPDLAAVILDIHAIIREAGLPAPGAGLRLEARDRAGTWFGGDPAGSALEPESLVVNVPDGDWALLGAPSIGWAASIRPDLARGRLTSIALILVAALLGWILGGREERLAREVLESGTRLDLALRAGQLGAWEFDISGRSVAWSEAAAAIFGYELHELDGDANQFFDRVNADDRKSLRRLIGEMLSGTRREYVTEFRVECPDGTRWVLAIGELERDAAGRPTRMLGVLSDASERHEIEERLRHSQRLEAVGTLAGGVAHDFNNLLTAIIGFTELALDRAAGLGADAVGRSIQGDLAQVLLTSERAATLTGQLLSFSRRNATAPARIDLTHAVRDMEPMLKRLLGDGNEFRTELTPGLADVWIDPGQLTQVLLNLIVNARDAMPGGGTVTLRTFGIRSAGSARPLDAPSGDWICVEIADSGVGMSAQLQARIFEPYFTTKEVGRGTGLGLAVVYGAVESAGGHVTVASTVGKGTVFRIYLPPRRATEEQMLALGAVSAAT